MCLGLSLISGKGGSGKTTISLSLSEFISSCSKKVLLVDCDMSTHGATYFFEPYLKDKEHTITTKEMFFNKNAPTKDKDVLHIKENFDFVPSCRDFKYRFEFYENPNTKFNNEKYEELKQEYDLIIFDCQAGFSQAAEKVTEIAGNNLIVLEMDAISASSIRILYTQLAAQLENNKTYQIFNKISESEYDICKNITDGTLFKNIEPILFDIGIKQAFSFNRLPEINERNPALYKSIYDVAISLFPSFKKDIDNYVAKIKIRERINLGRKIYNVEERKSKAVKRSALKSSLMSITTVILLLLAISYSIINSISYILIFASIVYAAIAIVLYVSKNLPNNTEEVKKYNKLKSEIDDITEEIIDLKRRK